MSNRKLYFFLLIFVFLSYCIEASKTYYQILDVPKDAPKRQIEKQFRKLSKLYHPDNPKTGDEAKYIELTEAFETLSDDDKRAHYDRFGKVDNSRRGGQPQGGAQFFTGGFPGGRGGFPFGGFNFGGFGGGNRGGGGGGKQCTKTTQCVNGKCTTTEMCY